MILEIQTACYPNPELIYERLLVSADAFAEHVVGPALVSEHDRHEDQGNDGHDCQRVL